MTVIELHHVPQTTKIVSHQVLSDPPNIALSKDRRRLSPEEIKRRTPDIVVQVIAVATNPAIPESDDSLSHLHEYLVFCVHARPPTNPLAVRCTSSSGRSVSSE